MTDTGECAFVLGMELVENNNSSTTMSQRRYINNNLKRFGMDDCKAAISSMNIGLRLLPSDAPNKVIAPFRKAVGALVPLLTATRPNIAFAIDVLRFVKICESSTELQSSTYLRYLQGTKTHGICFQPNDKIDFRGCSDADWAGDHLDRISTPGYAIILMSVSIT